MNLWQTSPLPCLVGTGACGGASSSCENSERIRPWCKINGRSTCGALYKCLQKNGTVDICEAVTRPHMRFVGIKMVHRQEIHNDRARFVEEHKSLANEMRGILLERGIVIPQGIHRPIPYIAHLLNPEIQKISPDLRELLSSTIENSKYRSPLIKKRKVSLKKLSSNTPDAQQLMTIPGVGMITATTIVGESWAV